MAYRSRLPRLSKGVRLSPNHPHKEMLMHKRDEPLSPHCFTADAAEGVAQSALSLLTGALQGVVTDLRAVHESLRAPADTDAMAEDEISPVLTLHLRSSIECAIADHLEPAIQTLGEAAIVRSADLQKEWSERRRQQ